MPRFILTGAPGAGKTALLRQLECDGTGVVEEAATDVIALRFALGMPVPWEAPGFVEDIVDLQRRRELARIVAPGEVVFFDRSPICTLALSRYSGLEPPAGLTAEVDRVRRLHVFERVVFFVENLGAIEKTAARQISFGDSLRFERIHRETYLELVSVPPDGLRARRSGARGGPGAHRLNASPAASRPSFVFGKKDAAPCSRRSRAASTRPPSAANASAPPIEMR